MKRRDFLSVTPVAAAAVGSSLLGCGQPSNSGPPSASAAAAGAADHGLLGTAHGSVWGRRGVTAAADQHASLAGTTILMQGGNAVDAIVAAAATLNVSEPYMSGIGGFGGFMVIYLAEENRVVGLDALGRAPAASSPSTMTLDDFEAGYKAPIVPGALKGWAAALERYGTMSLGDVFEPAIQLAEDGFVISKFDQLHTDGAAEKLGRFPSTTRVFFPNGRPPRMGEVITQPELAATMRHLARAGADDFYKGDLGDRIVSFLAENGGHMTKGDLESFDVEWKEPITTTFQGHDLYAMPPGSCGMSMFQALNIMDGFDLPNMDLYGRISSTSGLRRTSWPWRTTTGTTRGRTTSTSRSSGSSRRPTPTNSGRGSTRGAWHRSPGRHFPSSARRACRPPTAGGTPSPSRSRW